MGEKICLKPHILHGGLRNDPVKGFTILGWFALILIIANFFEFSVVEVSSERVYPYSMESNTVKSYFIDFREVPLHERIR